MQDYSKERSTDGRHDARRDRAKGAVDRLAGSATRWPSILRDIGAASLALWAVFLGELLATVVPLRAEVLLAVPGAVAAWWIFGAGSALFGTLVAAIVVQVMAADRTQTLFSYTAQEMAAPALLGLGLLVLCISLRVAAVRRERRSALLIDACAVDAIAQIRAANDRVASAEAKAEAASAELVQARRELQLREQLALAQRAGAEPWHDAFDAARRQEGGI